MHRARKGGSSAPEVVDRDQGLAQGVGRRLGEVHRHQQGPDEPRPIGHRHGVDVRFRHAGIGQGLLRQARDGLHVLAGGDLRHHAAVDGVHVRLGQYGVAENFPPVPDHRRGGLVAGGLKCQNQHSNIHSFAGKIVFLRKFTPVRARSRPGAPAPGSPPGSGAGPGHNPGPAPDPPWRGTAPGPP